LGSVASGVSTEKKNATGRKIAAVGGNPCYPAPATRETGLIHIPQQDQGEEEHHAGMRVPGAPQVLPDLIGHVRGVPDQ
jgi:hypothetical protein